MDIMGKVESTMEWIFNLADKQENGRKDTVKNIEKSLIVLTKSFILIVVGFIGLLKSIIM